MKKLFFIALLMAAGVAFAETEAELLAAATKGDYQAQRNLAYGYATGWGKAGTPDYIEKTPVKACSWYKVVFLTAGSKLTDGDRGNAYTYCKPLGKEQYAAADKEAKKIVDSFKKKRI